MKNQHRYEVEVDGSGGGRFAAVLYMDGVLADVAVNSIPSNVRHAIYDDSNDFSQRILSLV